MTNLVSPDSEALHGEPSRLIMCLKYEDPIFDDLPFAFIDFRKDHPQATIEPWLAPSPAMLLESPL